MRHRRVRRRRVRGQAVQVERRERGRSDDRVARDVERFDPDALHDHARPFSVEAFDRRFEQAFERAYAAWKSGASGQSR